MLETKKAKLFISILLIVLGVFCRFLPHIWNFTPIAAIALFSGVYLGKKYAFTLPVIAMFLGDIFLGFYAWPIMTAVYSSYLFVGLIGLAIKKYKSFETILAGSILSSVMFFVVTNFAVWQFSPWYAKSINGLLECYTLALPFFRNTLMGDMFYVGVFFGVYEMVYFLAKNYQRKIVIT